MKKILLFGAWMAVLLLCLGACTARGESPSREPQSPPAQQEPTAQPSTELPQGKPPKALESVPAAELAGAQPAAEVEGLSIYLRDREGNFLPGLPNDDQPKTGQVIAAKAGESGHVLGSYDTRQDCWGTLSPLNDGRLCFNNYQSLVFIDTASWEDSGFTLDFQQPGEPNCRISSLAQDPESGELALIYQVSSYERSSDGQQRSWLTYVNGELGASDAHMEVQRFDKEGRFLQRVVTELEPLVVNEVADCLPNRYRDGALTFFQGGYGGRLVTIQLKEGRVSSLDCDNAILSDKAELLYHLEWREGQPYLFHYSWVEKGQLVAELSLEEELDALTLSYGTEEELPFQVTMEPSRRQAELSYGGMIFHHLDFDKGEAQLRYDYSGADLGELTMCSRDGRYQLYCPMFSSGGEAYFEELLAQDQESGEIIRLGVLNNPNVQLITADNQLLVCYWDRLEACSLADGRWFQPLDPKSRVGNLEKPLDLFYDEENRLILLLSSAYADPFREDFSEEQLGSMVLEVYGEDWELRRSVDTGEAPPYSLKAYGPYSPGLSMETPGCLLLGKGEKPIYYLGD